MNNTKTPTLRFCEFSDELSLSRLGELCEYKNGGSFENYLDESGKYFLITLNSIDIEGNLKSNHKKVLEAEWYLQKNDLIMVLSDVAHGNFLGLVDIIPEDNKYVLNQRMGLLRNSLKSIDTRYLRSYINKHQRYFKKHGQGSSQQNLSKGDVLKFYVTVPSIAEQQKIADFLGLVDKWIENLEKQKRAIEAYKKGLMQKIFSQKIRFKDENGKDFLEWEEKQLGEILKEKNEYSTKGKGYPHISLTTQGVVPKAERYNRDFLVGDDKVKGYKITRLHDLCYNPANLKFGVISINKLGAGIFSPIYVTFEIIGQNIDFVGYYLIRNAFIKKARKYEQGTVYERMSVSPADFVKVKLALPSPPEQQKIADFLSSIDSLIQSKRLQVTKAKQWKKGLLQQMFV